MKRIFQYNSFFWNHICVFSKYFFSKFHFTTLIVLLVCFSCFTCLSVKQPLGNEWQWGLVALSSHSLQYCQFFFFLFPFAISYLPGTTRACPSDLCYVGPGRHTLPISAQGLSAAFVAFPSSGPQPWLPAELISTQASWFLRAPLSLLAWLCDWYPKWPESEFSSER